MDLKEIAEDIWDETKKKAYYIIFVLVVLSIPFHSPVHDKIYDYSLTSTYFFSNDSQRLF